ncbi:MAG: nucleotide exchange factor GrpE, partial [Spirochaetales bacterium]|nr:nucleotide exchange factor GrpE [Spirochaetales bacterium]
KGIKMIENQFIDLLFNKYGVVKFGEQGEAFDPNIHQAMMMEEGDYEKDELAMVFRSGYKLHDRVVRPAQVKVGKPANKDK